MTEQTRQAIDDYVKAGRKKPGEFLFTSRANRDRCISTRQYARLVSEWIASIGLDARRFGTHSLRRTKATLIYRRTENLRAVQLLLGHLKIKIKSTVRYLGIEVDDAKTQNLFDNVTGLMHKSAFFRSGFKSRRGLLRRALFLARRGEMR